MSTAWPVVVAALGSASLTIFGTFWLERWRMSRADRGASNDKLSEACVQMSSHALALALRAHTLYLTAVLRSGIGEGLDVALHLRKPIEPMELSDWLFADVRPMLDAQSVIEVTSGNELLIRSAADLVLAAMTVLDKASDIGESSAQQVDRRVISRLGTWLRQGVVPLRRDPEKERAIRQAVRDLGQQVRQFARVTREHLGVNDPDAVIRAFPELFADAK